MRAEIVSVGTELLLGQIVDTNSTWLSEQLAASGIDCTLQTKVGDNLGRIVEVLRGALSRADAVICGGGLGPTQDDITREAIAEVMGVDLVVDDEAMAGLEAAFAARKRQMTDNNRRQGEKPRGARIIPQRIGTAPGLVCELGEKVIYALPGVPDELREMTHRVVVPDLVRRSGQPAVIASRLVKTFGLGESRVADIITPRLEALDAAGPGAATIAFLARGLEGMQVRVTVKATTAEQAQAVLDSEEKELRALLGVSVFGVDDETIGTRIGVLLERRGLSLAVAESFTGGVVCSRLVSVPGASRWFRGGAVSYSADVKRSLLGVGEGPVVSEEAAIAMATGVARALGADVAVSTTGVAGPDPDEGLPPGVAYIGLSVGDGEPKALRLELPGDRQNIRDLGAMNALDALRRELED